VLTSAKNEWTHIAALVLERAIPEVPRRRLRLFVVDLDGAMIGIVTLDRRDAERPGHVRPDEQAELGYMFRPEVWGRG
jgi:hypothetical protein